MGIANGPLRTDPAEDVGRVAADRRSALLRVYRRRLRHEDLEDCYSQATLELLTRARRAPFESAAHAANALELRFKSRIDDRLRAIGGRSSIEAALERSVAVDGGPAQFEDASAAVERTVIARTEVRRLREVIGDLSRDQRLVLASQVCVQMDAGEFCARYGWSTEKYRKVAQRARGKLRALVGEYERGERCRRLEPDVLALSAGVADGEALARARAHLANCTPCARMLADVERSAKSVAALLPLPAAAAAGARFAGLLGMARRAGAVIRHPFAEAGASGGAGVAGGSLAGAGALKVGIAAVCVAGAAGGYAACAHLGVLAGLGLSPPSTPIHRTHHQPHRVTVVATHRVVTATRSPSVSLAATTPPSATRHVVSTHRRVPAIVQIRREFGTPRARASSAGATVAPPARATPVGPIAATPQERQTQTEFGFER
jgi:DNA-directed RNA polymerase specialized sigma24 family protein